MLKILVKTFTFNLNLFLRQWFSQVALWISHQQRHVRWVQEEVVGETCLQESLQGEDGFGFSREHLLRSNPVGWRCWYSYGVESIGLRNFPNDCFSRLASPRRVAGQKGARLGLRWSCWVVHRKVLMAYSLNQPYNPEYELEFSSQIVF